MQAILLGLRYSPNYAQKLASISIKGAATGGVDSTGAGADGADSAGSIEGIGDAVAIID